MDGFIQLVGSNRAVQILGIRLVGANAENGKKLIFTVAFLAALVLLRWVIKTIIARIVPGHPSEGFKFWSRQAVNVTFAALVILGLVSIWFDDPTRLTTAAGLVTAGLAFASQRAITSLIAELSEEALKEMERRYFMRRADLEPRVFYRLTDNWLEMSVRFVAEDAGIRELKDRISRDILQGLDEAGIGIASGTYNIVGLPPVKGSDRAAVNAGLPGVHAG